MTPGELARQATEALGKGLSKVLLVLPRRAGGSRRVKVLGGTKGVKILWGELACENADGKAVVYVEALDLLAWLAAYAGVVVKIAERTP